MPDCHDYPFAEIVAGVLSGGESEQSLLHSIAIQPDAIQRLEKFLGDNLYVFVKNIPGSLPETEPYFFASLDDAKKLMVEHIQDYANGLGYDDDQDVAKTEIAIQAAIQDIEKLAEEGGHILVDGYVHDLQIISARDALSGYGINPDILIESLAAYFDSAAQAATLLTQGASPDDIVANLAEAGIGNGTLLFEASYHAAGLDADSGEKFYFISLEEASDFIIDTARNDFHKVLEERQADVAAGRMEPYSEGDLELMSDDLEYVEDLAGASYEARKDDNFAYEEELFRGRANGYDYCISAVFPFKAVSAMTSTPGR